MSTTTGTRKQVLLLSGVGLHPEARALLETEVDVVDAVVAGDDRSAELLPTAHGLIGAVNRQHLEAAPLLEVIGIPGSGFDHVDVTGATEQASRSSTPQARSTPRSPSTGSD